MRLLSLQLSVLVTVAIFFLQMIALAVATGTSGDTDLKSGADQGTDSVLGHPVYISPGTTRLYRRGRWNWNRGTTTRTYTRKPKNTPKSSSKNEVSPAKATTTTKTTTTTTKRTTTAASPAKTADSVTVTTTTTLTTDQINELNSLTNKIRAANGQAALALNSKLAQVAQKQANDQASTCTLGHIGADGSTLVQRENAVGIVNVYMAENAAAGQQTVADVIEGWKNSAGHLANIINGKLNSVGYGMAKNDKCGQYKIYWTQTFAGL